MGGAGEHVGIMLNMRYARRAIVGEGVNARHFDQRRQKNGRMESDSNPSKGGVNESVRPLKND